MARFLENEIKKTVTLWLFTVASLNYVIRVWNLILTHEQPVIIIIIIKSLVSEDYIISTCTYLSAGTVLF